LKTVSPSIDNAREKRQSVKTKLPNVLKTQMGNTIQKRR